MKSSFSGISLKNQGPRNWFVRKTIKFQKKSKDRGLWMVPYIIQRNKKKTVSSNFLYSKKSKISVKSRNSKH